MKGEEKMQKKTMISISERENVVSLRTYSRDHQCSNNFFLLKKEIQQLMSERMIIVKDVKLQLSYLAQDLQFPL